jgi:excinuclease ABC subunit C
MRHFQSIEDVKAADAETLAQVPEIPMHVAEAIVSYFQNGNDMLQ